MLTEFVYDNLFKGFILQIQKIVFFYSGVDEVQKWKRYHKSSVYEL